jgi:phosphoglycerate dehydrogenase-like enzyme
MNSWQLSKEKSATSWEERVIDAADSLKVISFTGIAYKDFIPAWEYAESKGIKVANAPDGPTNAVAEWSVGAALLMNRHFLELGRTGEKSFITSAGLEGQQIGIIGLGRIGSRIAEMLQVFHPAHIRYYSTHQHPDLEAKLGITYSGLDAVLEQSDLLFLCVPSDAGTGFIGAEQLRSIKDGSLLVTFAHAGLIDEPSLLSQLQSGRIRAISDNAMQNPEFKELPLSHWYCFNGSNAFNTAAGINKTSDIVTESVLSILQS